MLISNSINKPEHVWEHTWPCLVDDILHYQRRLTGNQGTHLFNNLTLM